MDKTGRVFISLSVVALVAAAVLALIARHWLVAELSLAWLLFVLLFSFVFEVFCA